MDTVKLYDELTQRLTQLPFSQEDFDKARDIAKRLGYGESTAYTSTSALWGLFCLHESPATSPGNAPKHSGCIVRTKELGFIWVQTMEDLELPEALWD